MSISEGATHKGELGRYYKCVEGQWFYSNNFGHWRKYYSGRPANLIALEKKHEWSGQQDGLPPVNTECELRCKTGGWGIAKVKYMSDTMCVWLWKNGNSDQREWAESPWKMDFRPIRTAAEIAAEQRETAIREIMDIADVDCRVTAARLVDAGFKREVV